MYKCRPLVLLAWLTQQCILACCLQETALLNFNFSGMPAAYGSFGWRWLSTESAGVGEKWLWLTGLLIPHGYPNVLQGLSLSRDDTHYWWCHGYPQVLTSIVKPRESILTLDYPRTSCWSSRLYGILTLSRGLLLLMRWRFSPTNTTNSNTNTVVVRNVFDCTHFQVKRH